MGTKRKRKRCINCGHGDVIRYLGNKTFPLGVYCKPQLAALEEDADPRDAISDCSSSCPMWTERRKKACQS